MKKIIVVFFILALFSLSSVYADENTSDELIIYFNYNGNGWNHYHPSPYTDVFNNTPVEQTNSTQNNILQENTTTQNNNPIMANNTQSTNNTSNNGSIMANNTQSTNNASNNSSVMENTANPLIALLLSCILIPMGIYRKRK